MRLEYRDRYRLWNDLVRGSADRLFVATKDRPQLGTKVPIELHLPELRLPIVVRGTVVGWRGKSERFERGIYVRLAAEELDKCRRYFGLKPLTEPERKPRQLGRVHCEIPVRVLTPDMETECVTKNISDRGLLLACSIPLLIGQRLKMEIQLDPVIVLETEVAWCSKEREIAGLQIVSPSPEIADQLQAGLERIRKRQSRSDSPTPRPVLIADDDEMILQFLTKALAKHGFEIYQATNGDEAIEMVRHLHPAIVMLDIVMPGTDGSDVCKAMRADAELADIPVIFMSALEDQTLHQVADESGATDYVAKPVSHGDIINLIGRYLKT